MTMIYIFTNRKYETRKISNKLSANRVRARDIRIQFILWRQWFKHKAKYLFWRSFM